MKRTQLQIKIDVYVNNFFFQENQHIVTIFIGDNAMTSSIRIAQVFPELVGKKTRAIWKIYGGMLKI